MTDPDLNNRTRNSFLLSLILHVVIAFILGFVLIEHPQDKASEFVAVDMVKSAKRITPPRRMDPKAFAPHLRNPRKQEVKAQLKPQWLRPADIDLSPKVQSPETMNVVPELATNAAQLRSRFDMPLPRPAGANIVKPGIGTKQAAGDRSGTGTGSVGLTGTGMFETALYWIARNVVSKNKTGKEDIVFLIDASGTMEENIAAVARYLSKMIDAFEEGDLDYTIGVIRFNYVEKNNIIKVYEQTKDVNKIRGILRSIKCSDDERTLDAIEVGLTQVEYRRPVDKTFVLVTDEAFTPRTKTRQIREDMGLKDMLQEDFRDILRMCRDDNVKVNVMGIDDELHKKLAKETGGLWFQIPQQEAIER